MSETRERYNAGATRACFNCEGTMTRTDRPEPGWYCAECDTFLPDDQDKPRPGLDLCPKCGNDAAGLDLYADRSGDDTIVCRKCGAQLRGLDYPALLDYLYGRRNRQAD